MPIRKTLPLKVSGDSIVRFLLCLYFVISIFEPYLNGIIGSVTKYYMFFVMFVLLWWDGFSLRIYNISWAYILWLAIKLISLLWSEDFAIPKLHMISQLGMVLFLVILLSRARDEKTMDAIATVYWLSSLTIGVLSLFFSGAYRGQVEVRQVLVIMGVEIDPNNQAALLLVGIALCLNNLFYQKRRTVVSVIGLLINCYACFQTASRAAIITLGALALFCVLYSPVKRKPEIVLRNLALLCGAAVALYFVTIKLLPEANLARLFDFSSYEGGSNRAELWATAWQLFSLDLWTILFGAGWGTISPYLGGRAVHNTFLAMLCNVGLIGTLLFMIPIVVVALRMLKRKEPMPVLLLGAQLIPAFFIEAINKRFFWNAILILFMVYFRNKETQSERG